MMEEEFDETADEEPSDTVGADNLNEFGGNDMDIEPSDRYED